MLEIDGSGTPLTLGIVEPGAYTTVPTGLISLTGGAGTSGTMTGFWGLGEVTLTDGGADYARAPTVTVTGSGVGASLTAVVDGTTNWILAERSWQDLPQGQNDLKRKFHHSLQLDMQTGIGLDGTGQGTNPLVSLQWSDDGGHTWTSEHLKSAGKIGEYLWRVIWRRLGWTRGRVYRMRMTDPCKRVFLSGELEISAGAS